MSDEVDIPATPEQQTNEISADVIQEGSHDPEGNAAGEATSPEEFEIVLAGQDEPQVTRDVKQDASHILNRVIGRKSKLQEENARLQAQVQQMQGGQQPQQHAPVIEPEPDEYAFEDRNQYLTAKAQWQQKIVNSAITGQLNQQQNGHRVAAQEQERNTALQTYAENASKLKVSDFNAAQDNAFDVLGDEFAQLIAHQLPEEAPKLMYWLGKNPQEAARYRDEYQRNPGRTTFSLGKLAGKLTIQSKQSKAAQPETRIENASVGDAGGNSDWQKQYDQIMKDATPNNTAKSLNQIRKLKAEAKKAGYDTSTLK